MQDNLSEGKKTTVLSHCLAQNEYMMQMSRIRLPGLVIVTKILISNCGMLTLQGDLELSLTVSLLYVCI